jgi:hypothetical protein
VHVDLVRDVDSSARARDRGNRSSLRHVLNVAFVRRTTSDA